MQLDILGVGKTSTYYGHKHKGQRHQFQHLYNHTLEITKWDKFQSFFKNRFLKNYIGSLQSNTINS